MSSIIALDAISLFLSLMIFNLAHQLKPSFKRLIRPVLIVFYAVGVLAIVLALLETTNFLVPSESPSSLALHFVILLIMVLVVISLNHMRVSVLRAKLDETRALNRLKTEFLARTSHELKTPLTPLIMQLQLLQKGRFGKLSRAQLESLSMVERNITRLAKLINDILYYSKSSAGRIKLSRERVSLNKLVSGALETMETRVKEKGLQVSFVQGRIPGVEADPERITQVLINLLDNAVKFSEEGGRLWVETSREEGKVVFSVRDEGVGISGEDLPRLFQPFTQLSRLSTRKHGGTGIGLSISKSLVELHGGKIWAESEGLGHGTSFYFSLPIN